MLSNIKAKTKDGGQIVIATENWQKMSQGQAHLILENINENDTLFSQVLVLCIHRIDTLPPEFETAYAQVMNSIDSLSKYLVKKIEIIINNDQRALLGSMIKDLHGSEIDCPRVFLCENLAKSQNRWDYYLEFKPKSPLPDIYSESFLALFSEKYKLELNKLVQILRNCSSKEKTRWFKKNCLKKVKKNMNPLTIFHDKAAQYLAKLRPMRDKQNKQQKQIQISNQMLAQYLEKTGIFQKILNLQLLHRSSNDFRDTSFNKLWSQQSEKPIIAESIKKNILKQLQISNDQLSEELQKDSPFPSKIDNCSNIFQSIMRFLISWTWRDVSLILRIQLNPQKTKLVHIDLKVIDYELKQISKLDSVLKKDELFLKQYLEYLHVL